jgi:hypothetical protein
VRRISLLSFVYPTAILFLAVGYYFIGSENIRSEEIECSSGIYEGAEEQNQFAQSIEDTVVDCPALFGLGDRNRESGFYQVAYEIHKYYVEKCYAEPKSYLAFSTLSAENASRNEDWNRYIEYREFLKKVLYYSLDTLYYCSDVKAILGTMVWFDSTRRTDFNGGIAIREYILSSGKCPFLDSTFAAQVINLKKARHQVWKDTVTNPLLTPEDTTIPTLEDLSLGILRGKPVSVSPATSERYLGELIATRNPFTDILELKYRLDKSAMVRVDVYDLLGRAVYSEGQGYKAEGVHVLSLQSKAWASGSYYVRLSSPSGEVKTVKVVKE